jgi:peptidyl-prolyl cis-trans isomerase SurA
MKRPLFALLLCATAARAELKERLAAVVNGQPITLSDVEERVGPELARLQRDAPGPERDAARKDLLHRGMESLVDEKLIETEANSLGVTVSEEELQRALENLARQQGMELADFHTAIEQQGISWETARETVRRQTLMAEVLRYKVKPRKVSDEEVATAYATQVKDVEYEVRARHIFIATPPNSPPPRLAAAKAKAEEAQRRVKKGETFALVAREMSEGPTAKQGGDLGYFRKGLMLPAIEQPAFLLKQGEVSDLIKTQSGYHLVMVEDRRPVPPKPLAEVKEEIRTRLMNDSVFRERENYLSTLRKTAQVDEKL